MRERLARLIALATALLIIGAVLLFGWQQERRMAPLAGNPDPEAWAELYPLHYQAYLRSAAEDSHPPYDKLAGNPFRRRAYAGYAFELEHNAARAHYYAQIDQRESRRVQEREQPAGCINCHAAEAPALIEKYGWEGLHAMSYRDVADQVHFGSSCGDCHDARTMELAISRPSFKHAMASRGVDLSKATRQEMRSYVCAQCHVEYYFRGPGSELHLPWQQGLTLEAIEQFFDDAELSDWEHPETGAKLIKMQHPDFELYSQGVHAAAGVACADCHMPTLQQNGMAITDHWIRSPMARVETTCMGCHDGTAERLAGRVVGIQQNTRSLLGNTEAALTDLMDAIVEAQAAGAADEELAEARRAHRRAQLRWDFIDAENSVGFHASQEATRILTEAVDMARAGERSARSLVRSQRAPQP